MIGSSSLLSTAGQQVLRSGGGRDWGTSTTFSPAKDQSVKYLISNGQIDEDDPDNTQHSKFKSKQPLSYNDFFYSQKPNSQSDYAKMLDAQIQQKQLYMNAQGEIRRNERNIGKVNNMNPHLIPEPSNPPSYAFNNQNGSAYLNNQGKDSLFNPKQELQRTSVFTPFTNQKFNQEFNSPQTYKNTSVTSPLLYNQMPSQNVFSRGSILKTPNYQGNYQILSQDNIKNPYNLGSEERESFFDKWNQPGNLTAQQKQQKFQIFDNNNNLRYEARRGMLQKENETEKQSLLKERKQQELNLALKEQVIQKRKQQEAEQKKLQMEDLLLDQRIRAEYKQREGLVSSHQQQQIAQQQEIKYIKQQQALQQQEQNQSIKTVHSKAETIAQRNITNKKNDKKDNDPQFQETKELPRTPPNQYVQSSSQRSIQLQLRRKGSQESVKQEEYPRQQTITEILENIPEEKPESFNVPIAGRPAATSRARKQSNATMLYGGNSSNNINVKLPQEKKLNYVDEYYEFQQKIFSRQMATLNQEVIGINDTRSQIFKDMLGLREKSKHTHLMSLMMPNDILEANRYSITQRKQNLFNFHQLNDLTANKGNCFNRGIEQLRPPPGYVLEQLQNEKEQQIQLSSKTQFMAIQTNNNNSNNSVISKKKQIYSRKAQTLTEIEEHVPENNISRNKRIDQRNGRALSTGYIPNPEDIESFREQIGGKKDKMNENEFLETSSINEQQQEHSRVRQIASSHGYQKGNKDSEQFMAEILQQKKSKELQNQSIKQIANQKGKQRKSLSEMYPQIGEANNNNQDNQQLKDLSEHVWKENINQDGDDDYQFLKDCLSDIQNLIESQKPNKRAVHSSKEKQVQYISSSKEQQQLLGNSQLQQSSLVIGKDKKQKIEQQLDESNEYDNNNLSNKQQEINKNSDVEGQNNQKIKDINGNVQSDKNNNLETNEEQLSQTEQQYKNVVQNSMEEVDKRSEQSKKDSLNDESNLFNRSVQNIDNMLLSFNLKNKKSQ